MTICEDDIPFPRSVILPIILSLPSNTLELEVSSLKLLLGLESTDMREVDSDICIVAAVEADGGIDVNERTGFKPDTSLQSEMAPSAYKLYGAMLRHRPIALCTCYPGVCALGSAGVTANFEEFGVLNLNSLLRCTV
jgi:hypothetical protein